MTMFEIRASKTGTSMPESVQIMLVPIKNSCFFLVKGTSLINFVKYDSLKTVRSIGELTDDQLEEGMTEQDALKKGLIIRATMRVSALEQLFGKNYPIDDLRYVPFT